MIRVVLAGGEHQGDWIELRNGGQLENFVLLPAGSGAETIALVQEYDPDLIISRPHLPDMTGSALAGELRSQGREIPVLVLTDDSELPAELVMWLSADRGAPEDIAGKSLALSVLPASNRILNDTNSKVRHAVLNHLTVLLGYLEIISGTTHGQPEDGYLAKMSEAASGIHQCILLTRGYQGIGLVPPRWIDLGGVMADAASSAEVSLSGMTGQYMEVFGDPLLVNAFTRIFSLLKRASGDRGTVKCGFEVSGGELIVSIRSGDRDIRWEKLDTIFECGTTQPLSCSVFPAREILAVTGIGIQVNADPADFLFEIRIPEERFRLAPPGTDS